MPSRRQILFTAAAAVGLSPAIGWLNSPRVHATDMTDEKFAVQKTDEEWKGALTPEQYKVLRGHGTERAFTSPLNNEKRAGTFVCAACGQPLFASDTKFESGTGWPSFDAPMDDEAVETEADNSMFMKRTEGPCSR